MSQIQIKVNHGGLDIFMAQAVFNIRNGFAAAKHSCGTGVSEAVSRIDKLESFRTQRLKEVLFTDSINTVAGKFFTALIDKEAVLIQRFWGCAVFGDIEADELYGFGF